MSIRMKLILSYLIITILPIMLFVGFLHLVFHIFFDQLEEVKSFYNFNDNEAVEEFIFQDIVVIAEGLQVMKELDEQQVLRYMDHAQERLAQRQIGIFIESNDGFHASTIMNHDLQSHLLHESFQSENLSNGYYEGEEQAWIFLASQEENLSITLALNITPVQNLFKSILPTIIMGSIGLFLLISISLTIFMSRHFSVPLKTLAHSAKNIESGNYNHPITLHRQDEIGQLGTSFEKMRHSLKRSMHEQMKYKQNRKELLSNLSHDLKTPITSIMGHAQGMLDGVMVTKDRQEDYARVIYNKSKHLNHLIDELSLYSQLELEQIPFQFEKVHVNDYIQDIFEGFKLEYEEIKWTLLNECSHGNIQIWADRMQLFRVFENLLNNSIKYMDKADQTIHIHVKKIENEIQIVIEDNGRGMTEYEVTKAFDRLYRADSSRDQQTGGSGIGLAIVRQIVNAHNGKISINSKKGEGTRVQFCIPPVK
ncbi:sensor histidine kinase [Geomicrobium sp. JSM 1781026]|uniref:sensor histidine kinase n=1 Tax=Geomicrobium sp. JSM 1781026 TaxID=3344580 RepID=UPI0035C10E5B